MLKKTFNSFLLFTVLLTAVSGFAVAKPKPKEHLVKEPPGEMGGHGDWIASGGMGLTISPTTFLLSPQLEYVYRPNLLVGPLVQMGLGNGGVLFTGEVTGRYILGHHPRIKPSLEAGLGLAAASGGYASAVGVNIHVGMGCDYIIDRGIAVGTMIRANFAPPLKTFYLSWPILVARFLL